MIKDLSTSNSIIKPCKEKSMIVFMGSSYTRGGWSNEEFLSSIVQRLSGFKTVNLAKPCHGSEQYLSSFLYACEKYQPKLFFVETVSDRSGRYFYVPNETLDNINEKSPEYINQMFNTYGIENGGRHDFRIQSFSDPKSERIADIMKTCKEPIKVKRCLDYFNYSRILSDADAVRYYKTNNNFMSLEILSKLTQIPVLYYDFEGESIFCKEFIDNHVNADRHLNQFHNISYVRDYMNIKLNGKHLADDCHHNHEADLLVAKDLIIPFIKNYCDNNNIILDTV